MFPWSLSDINFCMPGHLLRGSLYEFIHLLMILLCVPFAITNWTGVACSWCHYFSLYFERVFWLACRDDVFSPCVRISCLLISKCDIFHSFSGNWVDYIRADVIEWQIFFALFTEYMPFMNKFRHAESVNISRTPIR